MEMLFHEQHLKFFVTLSVSGILLTPVELEESEHTSECCPFHFEDFLVLTIFILLRVLAYFQLRRFDA